MGPPERIWVSEKSDIARYINNFRNEIDGAALSRVMAEVESQAELAELSVRPANLKAGEFSATLALNF